MGDPGEHVTEGFEAVWLLEDLGRRPSPERDRGPAHPAVQPGLVQAEFLGMLGQQAKGVGVHGLRHLPSDGLDCDVGGAERVGVRQRVVSTEPAATEFSEAPFGGNLSFRTASQWTDVDGSHDLADAVPKSSVPDRELQELEVGVVVERNLDSRARFPRKPQQPLAGAVAEFPLGAGCAGHAPPLVEDAAKKDEVGGGSPAGLAGLSGEVEFAVVLAAVERDEAEAEKLRMKEVRELRVEKDDHDVRSCVALALPGGRRGAWVPLGPMAGIGAGPAQLAIRRRLHTALLATHAHPTRAPRPAALVLGPVDLVERMDPVKHVREGSPRLLASRWFWRYSLREHALL